MSDDNKLVGENENEKPSVTMSVEKPAKKAPKSKKKEQSATAKIVTWLKDVRGEFNKIIWPNRNELLKMTFTVIVTSLLFGVLIAGMDIVFRFGVDFLISVF